jgi:hypothetical protein
MNTSEYGFLLCKSD